DRGVDGLAFTLEAAHSRPRVLHSADTTGHALIQTLMHQVWQRPNIKIFSDAFTLGLWMNPHTGECQGVSAILADEVLWLRARAVVLATGGGGQVYSQTTNPKLSTGDGVALAWRVGAQLRDLEFFQFHPTALTVPGAPRFLISEAVRGEGAHLLDAEGRRFMFDYHPLGELAPRDVVSRSIFLHLQTLRQQGLPETSLQVWLDLRPIPTEKIQRRFPKIIEVCRRWGVDLFKDPIPVAPAAHYWMGGIVTDVQGRTTVPGLYAVGEVASTGVHGANRLASNSLLECLVFGAQLGANAAQMMQPVPLSSVAELASGTVAKVRESAIDWCAEAERLQHLRQSLAALMWSAAGICREAQGLEKAIAQVEGWQQEFAQLPLTNLLNHLQPEQPITLQQPEAKTCIRHWAETQNLLDNSYLILKSALFRTESRGGHYRLDYPDTDPEWECHTMIEKKLEKEVWYKSPPIPAYRPVGEEGDL
ncbi:MAG TPA: L-aspartate oxidase, partial [Stenomitos sp.]